jgi:hypothetical protein
MENEEALALALENAIPFFKANRESISELFGSDPPNLDEILGDEFCAYVEWKEFESWGLDGLNELVPLSKAGVILSIDGLYDDEGMPVNDEVGDPYDFYMPTLQAQLAPHNLQLVEICRLEGKVTVAEENPRFVCVRTAEGCVEKVNALLRHVGFELSIAEADGLTLLPGFDESFIQEVANSLTLPFGVRPQSEHMEDSGGKFELFPKEWVATYGGHEIRVRNSWNRGMRLYVDGVCRARTDEMIAISRSRPILSHQVVTESESFLIEVFCFALLTVKAKIVVDGQQIAGDKF